MDLQEVSYFIKGFVVRGKGAAGNEGHHTANLITEEPVIIAEGIYCAYTIIDEEEERIPSVVFFGVPYALPVITVPRVAVHLIGRDIDLYGKNLFVEVVAFVRENRHFSSAVELQNAIDEDFRIAQKYFTMKG